MNKDIGVSLAWAGGLIVLALGATLARNLGYMDQDSVVRLLIGANGLMIAFFGNRAPKALAPSDAARRLARVSGWSSVISGLIYAALWAFAPIDQAIWVGTAVIIAGIAVTVGYGVWLRGQDRGVKSGTTA